MLFEFQGRTYPGMEEIDEKIKEVQAEYQRNRNCELEKIYNKMQELQNKLRLLREDIMQRSVSLERDLLSSVKRLDNDFVFHSIGFFIKGEIQSMHDNILTMRYIGCCLRYSFIQKGNVIITKALPIEIKGREGCLPIGLINTSHPEILAKGSSELIFFDRGWNEWKSCHISSFRKQQYLKNAIIPDPEDKIYVTKWLLKQHKEN